MKVEVTSKRKFDPIKLELVIESSEDLVGIMRTIGNMSGQDAHKFFDRGAVCGDNLPDCDLKKARHRGDYFNNELFSAIATHLDAYR